MYCRRSIEWGRKRGPDQRVICTLDQISNLPRSCQILYFSSLIKPPTTPDRVCPFCRIYSLLFSRFISTLPPHFPPTLLLILPSSSSPPLSLNPPPTSTPLYIPISIVLTRQHTYSHEPHLRSPNFYICSAQNDADENQGRGGGLQSIISMSLPPVFFFLFPLSKPTFSSSSLADSKTQYNQTRLNNIFEFLDTLADVRYDICWGLKLGNGRRMEGADIIAGKGD